MRDVLTRNITYRCGRQQFAFYKAARAAACSALPLLLSLFVSSLAAQSPCFGVAPAPAAAADCAAHNLPISTVAKLDPTHSYTVTELIDLAERSNPRTRIAWERARQRANELGVAKSAYFPILLFQAIGGDQK